MSNSIRIKRRAASGDAGAPASLKNGELAYNEADNNLYYGFGDNGSGVATTVKTIGGVLSDILQDIEDISGTATAADQFIVSTGAGAFALESGNTARASLGLGTGNSPTFTALTTTSNVIIGGTLNGHTIPSGAGTLALTTDTLATHSGHSYIDISGQDIVASDVALGSHTSGNYVATVAKASGAPGITITGASGEGTAITVAVDATVARTTGATFTGLVNTDGGIAVDTDKFTVATSGNTVIAGTLGVTGVTTHTGLVNANGGIAVDTDKFTVADATGNTVIHGTLGVGNGAFQISGSGIITSGEYQGTDISATYIGALPASKITSGTLASDRLPVATATAKGAIELFSNTAQTVAANAVTATAGKTYGIQLNSAGQAVVNVPWSNTQTPVRPVKVGSNNLTSGETLEIVGGTNVTVTESGGVVTFNSSRATKASLGLDGDDDVAFGNLELGSGESTATLKAPATFTIDPSGHGDNTGKVVIAGDLQVDGTTTTINSTIVEIDDLAIELAHDATSSSTINGAGLRFGTNSSGEAVHSFTYVHADTRMVLSSGLKVTGGLQNTVLTSCTIDGGTF